MLSLGGFGKNTIQASSISLDFYLIPNSRLCAPTKPLDTVYGSSHFFPRVANKSMRAVSKQTPLTYFAPGLAPTFQFIPSRDSRYIHRGLHKSLNISCSFTL